ncbi:MAG: HAMP domain-containing sensor histidine kinase [Actinomycetota bacterium]
MVAARSLQLPRWTQSIRFRLSLVYALAVFVAGSMLIGGVYAWQVRQLDEPVLYRGTVAMIDPSTGLPVTEVFLIAEGSPEAKLREILEYNAYLLAIDNLKNASLAAVGVLFFVAFGVGWLLAGSALRPIQRMTLVARDITATDFSRRIGLPGPEDEMKGLADTFDAMLDRLQAAFEDQRRFIQDASHELRNPLAVARTNLELTLSDPDASVADLRGSADVAMRSTERMSVLVDDLLTQARTGVPEVVRSDVDLLAMCDGIVEEFTAAARARNLTLTMVAPRAELILRADGQAIRRAVSNLVSNAVKLAPVGTTVTITVGRHEQHAVIAVADEGPGLSEEDQINAFRRFWQADPDAIGTGLGLSIVKQIAERHGGAVVVDSAVGSGSTFAIKLPIVEQRTA